MKSALSLIDDLPSFPSSVGGILFANKDLSLDFESRGGKSGKKRFDDFFFFATKKLTSLNNNEDSSNSLENPKDVMRKLMNRSIIEAMERDDSIIYLGEDVRHGGYYLVTENVAGRLEEWRKSSENVAERSRIVDWLPDETSLIGAGIGG